MRTPLVGVLSSADLLLADTTLPAAAVAGLRMIHHSGRILLEMVDSLLQLTALHAGRLQVRLAVRRPSSSSCLPGVGAHRCACRWAGNGCAGGGG
jgi:signal transduction histidine kinase